MFSFSTTFGLLLVIYALFVIFKGRVTYSNEDTDAGRSRTKTWISRAEKPVQFWLFVIFILALAAVLFFNIFNLPF